jgi:hypothetical protein
MKRKVLRTFLLFALFGRCAGPQFVAAQHTDGHDAEPSVVRGSLDEVKGRRSVILLVSKSLVVDARDPALIAVEDYRNAVDGQPPRQHDAAARQIALKLNKYIRKYGSLTAAASYADADLIMVFKVTAQHRSAIPGEPFVRGKMYILAISADRRTPHVVWESSGDNTTAEDATDDFIKALKIVRREK